MGYLVQNEISVNILFERDRVVRVGGKKMGEETFTVYIYLGY